MSKFEMIDVEISDETMKQICKMFVKQRLSPASNYLFEEFESKENIEQALYRAVINEMCLDALEKEVKKIRKSKTKKD